MVYRSSGHSLRCLQPSFTSSAVYITRSDELTRLHSQLHTVPSPLVVNTAISRSHHQIPRISCTDFGPRPIWSPLCNWKCSKIGDVIYHIWWHWPRSMTLSRCRVSRNMAKWCKNFNINVFRFKSFFRWLVLRVVEIAVYATTLLSTKNGLRKTGRVKLTKIKIVCIFQN